MINTIFYFPSSLAQYLADSANINARTIAFIPPSAGETTGSIYKNGIRYGMATDDDIKNAVSRIFGDDLNRALIPIATYEDTGAVKAGKGLTVNGSGTMKVDFSNLENNEQIDGLDDQVAYILDHDIDCHASKSKYGAIKVGKGLGITDGVLRVDTSDLTEQELAALKGPQGDPGRDGADGANGAPGAAGVGIRSILKTGSNGLIDTYTISLTDNNTSIFTVTNGANGTNGQDGRNGTNGQDGRNGTDGRGIQSINKTGTNGLVDTYTIQYTDNSTPGVFTVTNGRNGVDGGSANVNTELEKAYFQDATGQANQATELKIALNKNDGSQEDPDIWCIDDITIGSATTTKAGLMSAADKTKLNGIESQVLADWNQTNTSSVDYIKNKPDLSNIGVESIATVNIDDATGEGASYTQASFGTKYYVTSLSTDEFALNTFTIPDPTNNVGKSIDVYTYFKEENNKDNVPVKIVCNTANIDIIRVDTGASDDENFLTLNTGDSIHFRVLNATTVLAYHYGTSTGGGKKTKKTDFDSIVSGFNTVLTGLGKSEISSSGATADVYTYLKAMYDLADKEWDNENSDLFKDTTYPEIYTGTDYRGSNDKYLSLCYKGMQAWLMAMCLSELVPSKDTTGSLTNNQTSFFTHAYDLVGNDMPLYDGYTLKGDPTIARLAAGAIYAKNHDDKATSIVNARKAFEGGDGGKPINASDWTGLGYENGGDPTKWEPAMTKAGYIVNPNITKFLLGAPGPWNGTFSLPEGQDSSLFDSSNNYLVDIAIDRHIQDTYIAYEYKESENAYVFPTPSDADEKEIMQRVVEAGVIPQSTDLVYFGKKKVKYIETFAHTYDGNNVSLHRFAETTDSVANDNDVYEYVGPFSDLMNKLFYADRSYSTTEMSSESLYEGEGGSRVQVYNIAIGQDKTLSQTATLYREDSRIALLKTVMDIADNCRYPVHSNYKRKRPNSGSGATQHRAATQQSKEGGFECGSLSAIFAENFSQLCQWGAKTSQDDFPGDAQGKSYPSGHSVQVWTLAMYLSQMTPSKLIDYMKGAYRFSVNRTIGKYHWNSDCMYGRVFGTMILPIINAMSGLENSYASLKSYLNGSGDTPSGGGSATVSYDSYSEGGGIIGSGDDITLIVHNESGDSVTFANIELAFDNDGSDSTGGFDVGGTVANGDTITLSNLSLNNYKKAKVGNTLVKPRLYINDAWTDCKAFSSGTFSGGATYDVYYGGSTASSVTGGSSSGSGSVSTTAFKVIINNNSGSTLTAANKISFLINDGESKVRATLDNSINIVNGGSGTYIGSNISVGEGSTQFAGSSNFGEYDSNIILYDASNPVNSITIGLPAIDPAIATQGFKAGATYTINYGGGSSPTSSSSSISFNLKVTNNSTSTISCNGNIGIMPYGENIEDHNNYYYRGKGTCTPWTLGPGESTDSFTVTVTPPSGNILYWNVNYPIPNESQSTPRGSNIAFYDGNGVARRLTSVPANGTTGYNGQTFEVQYTAAIDTYPDWINDQGETIPGYDWSGGAWS